MGNVLKHETSDKIQESQLQKIKQREGKSELIMDENYENRTACFIPEKKCNQEKIFESNSDEEIISEEDMQSTQVDNMGSFYKKYKENEIVKGIDRKHIVSNPDEFPFSPIGLLEVKRKDNSISRGTATLIADNIAITCAHNIYEYDHINKKQIDEFKPISFKIKSKNGKILYESGIKGVYFPKNEYIENDSEDYALIILVKDLGRLCGYMGIAYDYNLENEKEYNLYGYGHNKLKGMSTKFQVDENGNGKNIWIDNDLLKYDGIDTEDGQSGSAVWFKEINTEKRFLFALHVLYVEETDSNICYNQAIIITKKRFNNIKNFILQSKIDSCIIKHQSSLDLSNLSINKNEMKYLTETPCFKHLKDLNLSNCNINNSSLKELCECKFVKLEKLNLSDNNKNIGNTLIQNLINCSNFQNLTELNISLNNISEEFKYFKDCDYLKKLKVLDLSHNNIDNKVFENFIQCGFLEEIVSLNLNCNDIKSIGVKYLSKCEFLSKITQLNLGFNNIGDSGMQYLIKAKQFKNLTKLGLRFNNISERGIKFLKKCDFLDKIIELDLSSNKISEYGMKYLINCNNLRNLINLDLSKNNLGDNGVMYLIISKNLANLKKLSLRSNNIKEIGAKYIKYCNHFTNLIDLDLRNNDIRDLGMQYITEWEILNQIIKLNLSTNNIGNIGAKYIINSMNFVDIKELNLHDNNIVTKRLIAIQEKFPNTKVVV